MILVLVQLARAVDPPRASFQITDRDGWLLQTILEPLDDAPHTGSLSFDGVTVYTFAWRVHEADAENPPRICTWFADGAGNVYGTGAPAATTPVPVTITCLPVTEGSFAVRSAMGRVFTFRPGLPPVSPLDDHLNDR